MKKRTKKKIKKYFDTTITEKMTYKMLIIRYIICMPLFVTFLVHIVTAVVVGQQVEC